MTNDRAQEIVNLFKTEMRLLKKELAQLKCVSMATTQYKADTRLPDSVRSI